MTEALKLIEENHIEMDITSYNILMDFYCFVDQFNKAKEIFNSLPEKNVQANSFTFSILIKGLKHSKEDVVENGMNLFRKYMRTFVDQEVVVYNSILDLLVSQKDTDKVDNIFESFTKQDNVKPDIITFNTIIKGSCKKKNLDHAMIYFRKIKDFNLKPNRITYNTLLDVSVKIEKMNNALSLIEEMHKDDILPDSYTYSIILNGLRLNNSS